MDGRGELSDDRGEREGDCEGEGGEDMKGKVKEKGERKRMRGERN